MEWKEITQENCDELYELDLENYPIMIAHKWDDNYITYHNLHNCTASIGTMAKFGEYYYIVLPKCE